MSSGWAYEISWAYAPESRKRSEVCNQLPGCIVDENNNLVLAEAGTGQTSTTMGRVAFLVRSGQAQPEDILLLAYGSDAAEEMRERIGYSAG